MFSDDLSAARAWSWSSDAPPRGLGCVLVACRLDNGEAWVIAPPAVSLQLDEPDERRKQWRVAQFRAVDAEQLVIALGEHVPGSYREVTIDDVRSIVPSDLQEWIKAACDRQQALADGFGRQDPRLAPNEEHVRAASTRFTELAGATASRQRANEELEDAIVDVPDTVDEILVRARRRRPAQPADVASLRTATKVIPCLRADIEATKTRREHARRSRVGGDLSGYLDRLIHKPWGSEFRVYEDDLRDVWCLYIRPQHRTSLHCHPHKMTALLCLEGEGTLSTYGGVQYAMMPGAVLSIEAGAYHRVAAGSGNTGLRLVEIETPKDRFDLLRIEDDYRDVTEPYEGEHHAPLGLVEHDRAVPEAPALQPFVQQRLGAHRWARLRAQSSIGNYRFSVESSERVRDSTNVVFAISLDEREQCAWTTHMATVLSPETLFAALPETAYLTIRRLGSVAKPLI
jgi:mannose-6-phosphate isomerase-like protein (cupin superfamily)